jgi:hypothetical protein
MTGSAAISNNLYFLQTILRENINTGVAQKKNLKYADCLVQNLNSLHFKVVVLLENFFESLRSNPFM